MCGDVRWCLGGRKPARRKLHWGCIRWAPASLLLAQLDGSVHREVEGDGAAGCMPPTPPSPWRAARPCPEHPAVEEASWPHLRLRATLILPPHPVAAPLPRDLQEDGLPGRQCWTEMQGCPPPAAPPPRLSLAPPLMPLKGPHEPVTWATLSSSGRCVHGSHCPERKGDPAGSCPPPRREGRPSADSPDCVKSFGLSGPAAAPVPELPDVPVRTRRCRRREHSLPALEAPFAFDLLQSPEVFLWFRHAFPRVLLRRQHILPTEWHQAGEQSEMETAPHGPTSSTVSGPRDEGQGDKRRLGRVLAAAAGIRHINCTPRRSVCVCSTPAGTGICSK